MFYFQDYPVIPKPDYNLSPADQYRLIMCQAEQQIQSGLQTQYASTCFPIDWLDGGARINALLAAIGGGAVSAGGGGVRGGLQVLMQYAFAYGAYYGFQQGLNCQHWQ